MPAKSKFKVVDYPVAKLVEMKNPNNPRWMPDPEREALKASLTTFGVVEPVIVNSRTNQVVGGHQRIDTAAEAGIETLPVVFTDLDPVKEQALNLSLNKLKGGWDFEKLAVLLAEVNEAELLSATGFTESEADALIAAYNFDDEAIADGDGDDDDDGIVRDIRNRSEEEVQQLFETTEKVQFGMFSKAIPSVVYAKWVEGLKAKSEQGESPIALGVLVATRLGIDVIQPEAEAAVAEAEGENEAAPGEEPGDLSMFDGEGEAEEPIEAPEEAANE